MVCFAPLHTPYLHCILSYAIVSVAIQYGLGYLDEERKTQINFPAINGSGVQWQSSQRRQPTASVLELNDFNLFWQLRNRGTLENPIRLQSLSIFWRTSLGTTSIQKSHLSMPFAERTVISQPNSMVESLVPVTKGFLSPHQRISTDWLEHS